MQGGINPYPESSGYQFQLANCFRARSYLPLMWFIAFHKPGACNGIVHAELETHVYVILQRNREILGLMIIDLQAIIGSKPC